MPEAKELEPTPRKVLSEILNNKQFTEALINNNQRFQNVLTTQLDQLPEKTRYGLCHEIFETLTLPDVKSDQRKAVLKVLELLKPDNLDINKVIRSYQSTLVLTRRTPLSETAIDGMFDALHVFLSIMDEQKLKEIRASWYGLSKSYPEPEAKVVGSNIQRLNSAYKRHLKETMPQTEEKHESPSQAFYKLYTQGVNTQNTFKLSLLKDTPEFQEACFKYGVDIKKFWNINDPDATIRHLNLLLESSESTIRERIVRNLKKYVKVDLNSLKEDEKKVIADEIVEAVRDTYYELKGDSEEFPKIIIRLIQLLNKIKSGNKKSVAKNMGNVLGFLKKYGLEIDIQDPQKLLQFLEKRENLRLAEENYIRENASKRDVLKLIEGNFPIERPNFSICSRSREDLYLGDLVGDCTTFNEEMFGTNGWTVPIWLTNPGFTFFKIHDDDGNFLGKAGLFLMLSDGEPSLLIDPLEVTMQKDEVQNEKSKLLIKEGFGVLESWAKRIGLKKVFLVTFSNSSGLNELLNNFSSPQTAQNNELLGALKGLTELSARHDLPENNIEIYIQAHRGLGETIPDRLEDILNGIRGQIYDRIHFDDLLRSGDWSDIFKRILEIKYEYTQQFLGGEFADYQKYIDQATENLMVDKMIEDINRIAEIQIEALQKEDSLDESDTDQDDLDKNDEKEALTDILLARNFAVRELEGDYYHLEYLASIDESTLIWAVRYLYGSTVQADEIYLDKNLRLLNVQAV